MTGLCWELRKIANCVCNTIKPLRVVYVSFFWPFLPLFGYPSSTLSKSLRTLQVLFTHFFFLVRESGRQSEHRIRFKLLTGAASDIMIYNILSHDLAGMLLPIWTRKGKKGDNNVSKNCHWRSLVWYYNGEKIIMSFVHTILYLVRSHYTAHFNVCTIRTKWQRNSSESKLYSCESPKCCDIKLNDWKTLNMPISRRNSWSGQNLFSTWIVLVVSKKSFTLALA